MNLILNYGTHYTGDHFALALVFVGFTVLCRSTLTFTLLLKSKILNLETFSHVHVYRIEYILYRQGQYRICIISAADRIVPALVALFMLFVF